MKDENSILYVQTTDQPEKQYSPLVLAQTAKMMDLTPRVYYLGTGLRILMPGVAENIKLGTFPSVAEYRDLCMRSVQADAWVRKSQADTRSKDRWCSNIK
jgi:predicted peroxiredoxin